MDPAIISAMSAVMGSLVGGSASIATAFFTQRSQGRRERVMDEIHKRELVYTEFIAECSKLSIDAIGGSLESPAVLVQVYALQNRIRLIGPVHTMNVRCVMTKSGWMREESAGEGSFPSPALSTKQTPLFVITRREAGKAGAWQRCSSLTCRSKQRSPRLALHPPFLLRTHVHRVNRP